MTAKEFMTSYQRITEKIRQIDFQIYDIEQTLGVEGVKYNSQPYGSGGGVSNLTETTAIKLATLKDNQMKLRDKLWNQRIKIEKVIYRVADARNAEVLQRRYIRLQTWESIAADMKFDSRYIYKLHGKALVEVDKIIRKRKRT